MTWIPAPPSETLAATLAKGNTSGGLDLVMTAGDKVSGAEELTMEAAAGYNLDIGRNANPGSYINIGAYGPNDGYTYLHNTYVTMYTDDASLRIGKSGFTGTPKIQFSGTAPRITTISGSQPTLTIGTGSQAAPGVDSGNTVINSGDQTATSGSADCGDLDLTAGAVTNAGNSGNAGNVNIYPPSAAGAGADGVLNLGTASGQILGMHGLSVAQETVTGSRAGNPALADLLVKLANKGVIVDGTIA